MKKTRDLPQQGSSKNLVRGPLARLRFSPFRNQTAILGARLASLAAAFRAPQQPRLSYLGILLLLMMNLSSAQSITPDQFVLQEWKIKKIHCPAGCEPALKTALKSYLGAKISLGPNQFSGAMLENCDGPTEVELKRQSRQEKIDELTQLIGEKFQPASLSLPKEVTSAIVYCQGTNGVAGAEGARILSIEKQRLLILYAEQVILELQ